jgi:thiol-disulfide isomerase/thioredoxin
MPRFTRKSRNSRKSRNPVRMVTIGLVYANWCGHCQALKPEWKKMKTNVMKTPMYKRGEYKFVEIEDSDKKKQQKMDNVNSSISGGKLAADGFPIVFKVHNRKIKYFQGGRNAKELQNWFLGGNSETNDAPMEKNEKLEEAPRNVYSVFNRMLGGKTRKNKRK